ncbi:DUF429 domain-containing protein [Devosia chinhatensis]|uniref:DUF429 domain-containing protein n=1 Tax=Devosia aurantiaca TaxID=2714858 RepID=A0A6M1SSL7_9HYPH|nr:DUF429 domain-containing protein [Devosia aurantiaca]
MSYPVRTVLGIDAAWTTHNPSGLALAVETDGRWRLHSAFPSYARFYDDDGDLGVLDADRLLDTAKRLAGHEPDLIAVDMPLAKTLISARRVSDNAVSSHYGGRGAGTHSPSTTRPGLVALDLLTALTIRGYALATGNPVAGRSLVEVYPHPALIELLAAPRRLPYKIANRGKYWPALDAADRRAAIFAQWQLILDALDRVLPGALTLLPLPDVTASLRSLKAFEDTLDAVICAWVATSILDGTARPFGDADSAIWVPAPIPVLSQRSASDPSTEPAPQADRS